MRDLDEAPFLNFLGPEVQADPDGVYEALRRQTSVARTPIGAAVLHRDTGHRALTDPRLVSALNLVGRAQGLGEGPLSEMVSSTVLAKDGADHARLRRLVSRSFTPREADKHRPHMRALAESLVDQVLDRPQLDFVVEFADRYPIQVICRVLGVPREDHAQFARWGDALTYVLSLDLWSHLPEVTEAAAGLSAYLEVLIGDRRANPQDDLVTALAEAAEDADRLTDQELRAMLGGLLFAGYDTTRNQLGRAMYLFAQHPDQWDVVRQEPALVPNAVSEVMRVAAVVNGIPRIASEPLEIDGWHIPAGTIVFISITSANRDEATFPAPRSFDVTRASSQHLSFGAGPHYCLGANLARAEMEEALHALSGKVGRIRITGEPEWRAETGITGPRSLPLAFDRG